MSTTKKKPTIKKSKSKSNKVIDNPVITENIPINKIEFPVITIIKTEKIDLNWFALSKTFKSYFAFIYQKDKKENKYLNSKCVISNFNYKWFFDNLNSKIKKYFEIYCLIWDYYINKKQGFDINKKIEDMINYG